MHLLALAWRKQFEHIPKVLALVEAECGCELGHGPGTVGWGLNCIAKWEGVLLSGVPKDNKALGHIPLCTSIFLCRDLNNLFSKANPNPRGTEQAVLFNCFSSTCKRNESKWRKLWWGSMDLWGIRQLSGPQWPPSSQPPSGRRMLLFSACFHVRDLNPMFLAILYIWRNRRGMSTLL